jgi:hypothetical protein
MHLVVAGWMEQNQIPQMVSTALRAWHKMMDVPARHGGDRVMAYWTCAMLVLPQGPYPSVPLQGVAHLNAETLFAVPLPLGIIGVCVAFDCGMPCDGHTGSSCELDSVTAILFSSALSEKHPLPCPGMEKVLLRHPLFGLGRMSSGRPLPQRFEDGAIHPTEDAFAHHVALIIGPSLDDGIELPYQCTGCGLLMRLDDVSDCVQECVDTLGGGFDEQLPVVLAYIVSEKVKAILDVRYPGFLG